MKILQIDGIKGVITTIFVGACLFAGFVVSPGYVAMALWNKYMVSVYMFPQLNLFQGVLLWLITVITYCILTKDGFAVSFRNTPELSDEELKSIIQKARLSAHMQMMNRIMSKSDRFETLNKNPFGINENSKDKDDKISKL